MTYWGRCTTPGCGRTYENDSEPWGKNERTYCLSCRRRSVVADDDRVVVVLPEPKRVETAPYERWPTPPKRKLSNIEKKLLRREQRKERK
jgi:hypothetical protein